MAYAKAVTLTPSGKRTLTRWPRYHHCGQSVVALRDEQTFVEQEVTYILEHRGFAHDRTLEYRMCGS